MLLVARRTKVAHPVPLFLIWQEGRFGVVGQLEFRTTTVADSVIKSGMFEKFAALRARGLRASVEFARIGEGRRAAGAFAYHCGSPPAFGEHALGIADGAKRGARNKWMCGFVAPFVFLSEE